MKKFKRKVPRTDSAPSSTEVQVDTDAVADVNMQKLFDATGPKASTLEDEGTDKEVEDLTPEPTKHIVQFCKVECIRCPSLFPEVVQQPPFKARVKAEGEKSFSKGLTKYALSTKLPKCHYENGNADCPAKEIKVVVGLNIAQYAKRFIRLEREGDFEGLAELGVKISKSDASIQEAFSTELASLRRLS